VNPGDYGGRVGGTIGSPNTAAAYLCLTLSLAIGVLAARPTGQLRRLTVLALSLGVLALIVTGSRGGWVAFAISSSLIGVWTIRRRLVRPRTGGLVVLCIVALSTPFWGTITQRVVGNDNGAASSRVPLMKLASEMISAHPLLGLGVNNVGVDIPEYAGPQFDGQWLYTVHNKYLLVWAEAGIGALLAFVWFLVVTLRRGLRSARSSDRTLAPLAVGLAAGIAGQLIHFGVDLFQSKPDVEGLWLAAGLLAAIELILLRERRSAS
jgi:O-antigen ligase